MKDKDKFYRGMKGFFWRGQQAPFCSEPFIIIFFKDTLVLCHRSKTELLQRAQDGRKRKEGKKARKPEEAAEEKSSAEEMRTEETEEWTRLSKLMHRHDMQLIPKHSRHNRLHVGNYRKLCGAY